MLRFGNEQNDKKDGFVLFVEMYIGNEFFFKILFQIHQKCYWDYSEMFWIVLQFDYYFFYQSDLLLQIAPLLNFLIKRDA